MIRRPLPLALVVLLVGFTLSSGGQPAAQPDKAFDELVPPQELNHALLKLDPVALAAVAAKTDAAEKQLGRKREPTALQLYEITIRVAGERRAFAVLDRLAEVQLLKADTRLSTILRAAKLAAAGSRGGNPEMIPLNEFTPDQFSAYRNYQTQIQDAKALADPEAFDRLAKYVEGVEGLTAKQKKFLAKEIADAAASLPKSPPMAVAAVKKARDKAAAEEAERGATLDPPMMPPMPTPPVPTPNSSGGGGTLASKLAGDTSTLVDDGFEGRIDLAKIGKAWGRGDASALADAALRMAEEEDKLGRPHKHVPAKALLQASFGLAIANSDSATIARLEKVLKRAGGPDFEGKEDFLARLNTSKGLVASSRKGQQPFLASIDMTAPESFRAFRTYLDRIQAAAAQRDKGMLAGLTEGLDTVIELDDAQRSYLRREAAQTGPGQPPAFVGILRTLEGESRTGTLPPLNAKVLQFCREKIGQQVDNGSSEMLAARAFDSAGAKAYFPSSPDADYLWGKVVKPADAQPGDILQFREAVLTFAHPDGRTQSWSYYRHTAVISEVEGPSRFIVLQQNVGPAGKDEKKRKNVQVGWLDLSTLKKGKAVIYRPQPR